MSRYNWEHGSIKLPSSEFARVRKAMQDADSGHKEAVFAKTQEVWKGLSRKQQTDPAEYRKACTTVIHQQLGALSRPGRNSFLTTDSRDPKATAVLEDALLRMTLTGRGKPVRVTRSDMHFPTNRTTIFHTSEASISFDRENSTVEWDVPENNHAVERARQDPQAQALFDALESVKWTRGTGGVFTGNDEYNREDNGYGGGGNCCTDAYGPADAAGAPEHCHPYTDSKGHKVTRQDLSDMRRQNVQREMDMYRQYSSGTQGRVAKGVRAGGQFTQARRGESGVRL